MEVQTIKTELQRGTNKVRLIALGFVKIRSSGGAEEMVRPFPHGPAKSRDKTLREKAKKGFNFSQVAAIVEGEDIRRRREKSIFPKPSRKPASFR